MPSRPRPSPPSWSRRVASDATWRSAAGRRGGRRVTEELGPIDILVNNAGFTRDNILLRLSQEDWNDVLATNLTGAFNDDEGRAQGNDEAPLRAGSSTSRSVIGSTGNKGQANYAASEGRPDRLHEVGRQGICQPQYSGQLHRARVHRDRPDAAACHPRAREALLRGVPLGRLVSADDMAGAVLFLASNYRRIRNRPGTGR